MAYGGKGPFPPAPAKFKALALEATAGSPTPAMLIHVYKECRSDGELQRKVARLPVYCGALNLHPEAARVRVVRVIYRQCPQTGALAWWPRFHGQPPNAAFYARHLPGTLRQALQRQSDAAGESVVRPQLETCGGAAESPSRPSAGRGSPASSSPSAYAAPPNSRSAGAGRRPGLKPARPRGGLPCRLECATKTKIKIKSGHLLSRVSLLRSAQPGSTAAYLVSGTQDHGSFGKFRYAIDPTGQRWAIKELRIQRAPGPRELKTCVSPLEDVLDELRAQTRFGGLPIEVALRIEDTRKAKVNLYVVMPLMVGSLKSLRQRLLSGRDPTWTASFARYALSKLAEALARVHDAGWMHLDVKPSNALYNDRGEIYLADFGFARPSPARARDCGRSPPYAAPEVVQPNPSVSVTPSADTWSLGATALHLITGSPPPTQRLGTTGGRTRFRPKLDPSVLEPRWQVIKNRCPRTLARKARGEPATLDSYLAKVALVDPTLGNFVIEQMMRKRPADRVPVTKVPELLRRLDPIRPFALNGFDPRWVSRQASREAVFAALEASARELGPPYGAGEAARETGCSSHP